MLNWLLTYALLVCLSFLFLAHIARYEGDPLEYWQFECWVKIILMCCTLIIPISIFIAHVFYTIIGGILITWLFITEER